MVRTIAELFYEACSRGRADALASKKGGKYVPISHAELQRTVEHLVLALKDRGLAFGDHVAILAENRPEWAMTDFACAILGLPLVTIYPTLNAHQAAFILKDSGSKWVVVSNRDQLDKVMAHWAELPELSTVVLMEGQAPAVEGGRTILKWDELLARGGVMDQRVEEVRALAKERTPDDLLTLIYTSGTTADPKGAMLTHGNLVSNALASLAVLPELNEGDRALSFLPLTHIFERMCGQYALFHSGVAIYYAESIASVAADLMVAKPTLLCSVPRIYEKIYARIMDGVAGGSFLKRAIFGWAMGVGKEAVPHFFADAHPTGLLGIKYDLADRLVFSKIRERTGGRLRFAVSGGAPLAGKLMEFFWSIGLPILEGYGLTETSPVICVNRIGEVKAGSVGRPLYETWEGRPFMRIAEDGEILCQGPNVMKGYWNNPKATEETIDAEGWFHTGDIGVVDEKGRLSITDRKKELIVTSGGKKIAPQPIENQLKTDKYISQVVLVGDQRNFITALVVPNFDSLERWAGLKKLQYRTHADLVQLPMVKAKLMSRVEKVNQELSRYEQIKKIAVLDQELTLEAGFLTPSLKVKRRVVNQAFGGLIESLYDTHKGESEAG